MTQDDYAKSFIEAERAVTEARNAGAIAAQKRQDACFGYWGMPRPERWLVKDTRTGNVYLATKIDYPEIHYCPGLYGHRIKKDGTPSQTLQYISNSWVVIGPYVGPETP